VGDTLRTGHLGRLRVVFQDESVTVLSDNSQMVVAEHLFAPESGTVTSVLNLVQGKLRALASQHYQRSGASYQIQTPTAVAGVRGTEFIVSFHDDVSEIVGVSGFITAARIGDPLRRGVIVGPGEVTVVAAGLMPTTPRRLPNPAFDRYIEGVSFVGGGEARAGRADPFLSGNVVPEPDRATLATPANAPGLDNPLLGPDVSSLVDEPVGAVGAIGGRLRIEF
jgi:hypothetical protein